MQLDHEAELFINSDVSCPDCGQFAAGFEDILTRAHWKIAMGMVAGPGNASPTGITIETPDPLHPSPEAESLIRALREANVPFDLKKGRTSDELMGFRLVVAATHPAPKRSAMRAKTGRIGAEVAIVIR